MENSFSNSGEGLADAMLFADQQSDFYSQVFNSTGPGDEDDDESEEEVDEEGGEEDTGNDEENPPRDKNIVHSPVTIQVGPGPK